MQGKQEYQPKLFSVVQLEALIPKNHLLMKLDQLLDLSFVRPLTQEFYSKNNGRPSIDPEVYVRMLLIEYLYDIPSDRQLCEEIGFNLAFRWFCRFSLENKIPDHSSMTTIRDRLGEQTFEKIFVHVVKLCEQNGLVKGKRVMTDGSLIKANAALKSLVARKVDSISVEAVEVKRDDDEPPTDAGDKPKSQSIKGKHFSNKTHVSHTDPDATLAGKQSDSKALRYNLHQSIDPDHRVIIDCHITTGAVPDGTVYRERVNHIESRFGYKLEEATADRGYGYGENLQFLKDKGIRSFIPRFHKDVGEKCDREKTPYDESKDEFRCEQGNRLLKSGNKQSDGTIRFRPVTGSCGVCEKKPWCVIKRRGLRVSPYHQVQYETRLAEKTDEFRANKIQRMWKVEGLFAEAKNNHGLSRARYRRRWKVQVQAYLIASVQNLKRLLAAFLGDLGHFFEKVMETIQLSIKNIFQNKKIIFAALFA